MRRNQLESYLLEALLQAQFVSTIGIICSVALLEAALDMAKDGHCYAAYVVCIAFYGTNKGIL